MLLLLKSGPQCSYVCDLDSILIQQVLLFHVIWIVYASQIQAPQQVKNLIFYLGSMRNDL